LTCGWDVTGTQAPAPTTACYETATFNTLTCGWDVTGTQAPAPTTACYETATFNTLTCGWDVTGTQAPAPTTACYETATFNSSTCGWDVSGTQAPAPTTACYETATFNTLTCGWDVTGTQPPAPTTACYETATFNTLTCGWDVTGTQEPAPTNLSCWETATFNTTSCSWVVSGTPAPAIVTNASACGSYTWTVNNQQYTASGSYTFAENCQDYTLNLTVTPAINDTIEVSACDNYNWNGNVYSQSGTYTLSANCDNACAEVQTSPYSCSGNGYTSTISTNSDVNVGPGQTVRISAASFNKNLNISGGTLVICGSAAPQNINMNTNGAAFTMVVNGSLLLNNLNLPTNTVIKNYGSLTLNNSVGFSGEIQNYGSMTCSADFNVNSGGKFYNYATASVNNHNNSNISENRGTLAIGNRLQNNGGASFKNTCTLNVGNEFINNSSVVNEGSVVVQQMLRLNSGSTFENAAGKTVSTKNLILDGTFSGVGSGLSRLSVTLSSLINSSGRLVGTTSLCDANGVETNNGQAIAPAFIGCSGNVSAASCCNTSTLVLTITPRTSNTTTVSACESYTWVENGTTYSSSGEYSKVTGCNTEILNLTITPRTQQPSIACYQIATFNTTTCSWDVTGTQEPAPTNLSCWQTATFNTTSCDWDVTGTQPSVPTTACYETATFNTSTCGWDVTGTQPSVPTTACYETATFNTSTCGWDVTGTQAPAPTTACYETATFNTSTCGWDVTGTQPTEPTNLECYQSAVFNNTDCSWDISGTSPVAITSVTGDSPLCVGATALYNANGVVLGGGLGAWSSSNPSVASVDASSGSVTAIGAGNTNIIYTITANCGESGGRAWETRSSASDLNWQSVAFDGAKFVAVGRPSAPLTNSVMTSTDGNSWTNVPHGLGARNFNDVIYANNMFVAVSSDVQTSGGTQGSAMYSSNGTTWTLATAPRGDWQSVAYGNGTFVAVASFTTTTKVMTSTDGINWTSRTPSSTSNIWRGVTFGNGLFVAVSTSGTANIMTSPNGINWTAVTPPGNAAAWAVAFGNEKFVAVSQSGAVMTSTDGSSWTIQTSAVSNAWNDVTFADGVFVAVASSGTGNRIMTSADGISWVSEASAADNKWNGITYGNGKFVVVGETGTGNRVMVSSVAAGTITVSAQQTLTVNPTPAQPTNLSCWQTATFNTASCSWDVTGTQEPAPTNLSCWESASFNTETCSWNVTGTQPAQPGTPVSLASPFDISSLPGYGVATSALFNFNAAGGWAGWSVPAGKVVLGAKIISAGDNFTDFAVFRPASPGQVFPHYTFGANEYGWVMQAKAGQSNNGVQIEVYYSDPLSNYSIIQSVQLNYNGAGGYGGWSAPAGDIVSGGGYQFNNSYSSAAISALAVAGSSWPSGTISAGEQAWIVRGPSNNLQNPGRIFVVSFTAPANQNCWDNFVFDNTSCQWQNTGTQPTQPTNLACYQTATFNTTSCNWDVTGTQEAQPTGLACWQTATFNTTSCAWDVTGTQPAGNFVNPNAIPTVTTDLFSVSPSVEARARWGASGFEAVLFTPANPGPPPNGVGLNLDPSGAPIWGDGLTRNFKFTYNASTGASTWSIDWNNNLTFGTGEIISSTSSALVNKGFNYINIFLQGANVNAPATGASVTVQNLSINGANFGTFSANNSTVVSQNIKNSSGVFGDITATGNITFVNGPGTLQERPRFWIQLGQPVTLQTQNCWDNYVFNNVSCQWENIGTQEPAPTNLSCWQTATFNTTSCGWDVTGTQEAQPTGLACWQTATFNTTSCGWDVTGTQEAQPTGLACYQTATFNTTSCNWDVTGTQEAQPTGLACWQTATFNTTSCAWDVTGTQEAQPTSLACWQTATFNTTSCTWVVTGTQPQAIVTNASACGSYTWTANSQQYTSSGTYSYSANCQDYSLILTINNSSVAASSISTASTSVNPSATFTLSVVGGSLGTGATWKWYKTSCGGTAIGTGASISVSQTVATTYFVRAEGTCGTTDCKSITVNMNCGPTSITSNRPANTVCKGTSITLTVQGTVGIGGSWRWYKGGCGVGTICATGSSITVTPTANTTYFVRSMGSTCGTTVCQSISVIVNSAPATPGTISGSTVGLCGATAAQYSVAPVSGATTYTWTVPTGAVITAGQGTRAITVNFAGASNSSCGTSSTISVKASNSCGTSTSRTLTIGLRPAKATAINGSATACKLAVVTYSVTPIAGATSYTWTVPTGWVIQDGQGTANVTIRTGTCSGSIGVTANSICGNNGRFTRSITLLNCARYAEDNSSSEEEITEVDNIRVYPNPGFGEYTIVTPSLDETAVVYVYSMDGRLVSTLNVPAQSKTVELHLNDVAKGIYLVRFVSTSLSQDIRVIKQ
jgi:hypothetical protein